MMVAAGCWQWARDIADTDATYQYRMSQMVLAFATAAPK